MNTQLDSFNSVFEFNEYKALNFQLEETELIDNMLVGVLEKFKKLILMNVYGHLRMFDKYIARKTIIEKSVNYYKKHMI